MGSDDSGWVGRTLAGRYTVARRIGSGGMSTVYEATDEQLGRSVAVKLFNPGEARDDSRRRSEVDVLARLNHSQLVTMYDAHLASGDDSVPSFLVMELVNGPDLRSTLDHGPLRGEVAAQVAVDIAQGLAAMHAQGIVHRDLKPANILLAPTGLPSPTHRAKLADFGIAHLVGADRMTTVGTIIGTASYLSPEQASGTNPGPETDVYALGLVILEGLKGQREYPGTVVEAMSARAYRDPVIGGDIPPSWVSLLTQMTARDPLARPTALEVAVRSQDIARDLEGWDGTRVEGVEEPTAPLPTPTVMMPAEPLHAPTVPMPAEALHAPTVPMPALSPAPRGSRRGRIALVTIAAGTLLAGGVWFGGTLLAAEPAATPVQPVPTPSQPIPAPAQTEGPSPTDPTATQAAQTTSTAPSTATGAPAPETVPPTSEATATPDPPAATGTAPGNSGIGNGNNGNGNNGNGNGNGKGGNGKG
ncbi:hypothetical protein B7R22_14745 [Subtercola boreus]|uniref:non-specific serine/threonine protein kinase n=1 Tax=Subtercola boreus TaxID=120213 RepID=A0A3E0VTF7_9MICO|nr:serine/threonine-protein kinase [Subtercola boreus]RFA12900.1 hypothetical protein B7R22_14745 [Subtercola boreus]